MGVRMLPKYARTRFAVLKGINHGCGQRENAFARFCFASLVTTGRHDSNNITGAGRGAIDAISLRSIKALRFFIRGTFLCWDV